MSMRTRRILLAGLLAIAPFAVWMAAAQADETAAESSLLYLLFGIIEGPDPIPPYQWDPALSVGADGSGDAAPGVRDDGRPDFALDPRTGLPVVVWAYDNGTHYDIAFNQWLGTNWTRDSDFLTTSQLDEIDPRVYVHDDGTAFAVWWEKQDSGRILLRRRRPGRTVWQAPTEVMGNGRRPTVAVWSGRVLVAYERDGAAGGQEIVVAVRRNNGMYATEVVNTTSRTDRLDVELHVADDRLWMDWKHSANQFAYSEMINGSWTAPTFLEWTDTTWLGEELLRLEIEEAVLAP